MKYIFYFIYILYSRYLLFTTEHAFLYASITFSFTILWPSLVSYALQSALMVAKQCFDKTFLFLIFLLSLQVLPSALCVITLSGVEPFLPVCLTYEHIHQFICVNGT